MKMCTDVMKVRHYFIYVDAIDIAACSPQVVVP